MGTATINFKYILMKIKIWESEQDEGGYMFDIWVDADADERTDCDDGGFCTGSYQDAIDMACEQAKGLLKGKREKRIT